ncbi:MAG: hypothetical protein ABIH99_02180 [Candidatus Micrarchaeota archaeon]
MNCMEKRVLFLATMAVVAVAAVAMFAVVYAPKNAQLSSAAMTGVIILGVDGTANASATEALNAPVEEKEELEKMFIGSYDKIRNAPR